MADGRHSVLDSIRHVLEPIAYWANNPLTIAGVVITTAASFSMIYSWLVFDPSLVSPYAGIVMWMALPAMFVLGLVMIPAGMLRRRHSAYKRGTVPLLFPPLDFNQPTYRRPLAIVMLFSLANIAIMTTATYKGVHYMDSVNFCGLTCHKVMAPEFTAYQNSPHSRVACVGCHIGPGASWFVRSKLSGSYQVYATTFNKYPRPIPTPVANLRPARETCEQCHWPAKFAGDRMRVVGHFADDESNTRTTTVMLLRIGGEDPITLKPAGIHGVHMAPGTRIEYLSTDRQRQEVPLVVLHRNGETETFKQADAKLTAEQMRQPMRTMDCVDCHNRPSHNFELPEPAVDRMMDAARISPELPLAKKKSVELLRATYGSREEATQKIPASFSDFYRSSYPQVFAAKTQQINQAGQAVAAIYLRNVFPEMNITWGTYSSNLGHTNSAGCFRCHDGGHQNDKGNMINNDCSTCHNLLAVDEKSPKILQDLGIQQ